jgi:hypothetical protein
MSRRSEEEVLLRNYLLGGLDEATQEQVEERLLCDDDFAERLSAAQNALIDDYVFDALSDSERESYNKNFIVDDERRQKILFAQAMEIYVDEHDGPRPHPRADTRPQSTSWRNPLPFVQAHKAWVAASAVILLLLLLTPVMLMRLRPPDQAALLRERRASIERRIAEVNKRPASQSTQALPASELALQPTLLREDGGLKRVTLAGDIKLLTLKLALPQARHETYRALVLTVEGEELFAADGLTPEVDAGVAAVRLNLPAEFLATGDYQIQLRGVAAAGGVAEVGRYSFRVIK